MQKEITLKEIQLILSAFRNWRLLVGGMGDWSKIDRLEKKLIRNARLLTMRAPDARKSAVSTSSLQASADTTSQTVTQTPQRG